MNYIKEQTGLKDSDIGTGKKIITNETLQEYHNYHNENQNKTQIGLLFCDGENRDIWMNIFYCNGSSDFSYYLVLNKTDSLSVIFHDVL